MFLKQYRTREWENVKEEQCEIVLTEEKMEEAKRRLGSGES
jgi:hypothetical protein